jgi:hypothetical protein
MVNCAIKAKSLLALIAIIILLGLAIICFTILKEENYEVQNIVVSNDVLIYENIEDMAKNADLVVVGYFNELVDTINMLRDPYNVLLESPYEYAEGRIYDFLIDEVIAGEIDDNKISVGLSYSYDYEFIDKQGVEKHIQVPYSLYKSPKPKQKYVLFLYKNEELDTYFIPFEPYRLLVNEEDTVSIDSSLVDNHNETSKEHIVKLEETKEELHIFDDVHGEIEDKITGKKLAEIKETIKANFND